MPRAQSSIRTFSPTESSFLKEILNCNPFLPFPPRGVSRLGAWDNHSAEPWSYSIKKSLGHGGPCPAISRGNLWARNRIKHSKSMPISSDIFTPPGTAPSPPSFVPALPRSPARSPHHSRPFFLFFSPPSLIFLPPSFPAHAPAPMPPTNARDFRSHCVRTSQFVASQSVIVLVKVRLLGSEANGAPVTPQACPIDSPCGANSSAPPLPVSEGISSGATQRSTRPAPALQASFCQSSLAAFHAKPTPPPRAPYSEPRIRLPFRCQSDRDPGDVPIARILCRGEAGGRAPAVPPSGARITAICIRSAAYVWRPALAFAATSSIPRCLSQTPPP